jgi:flavin-binding protein dodecin
MSAKLDRAMAPHWRRWLATCKVVGAAPSFIRRGSVNPEGNAMSVAKVSELSATSSKSFEDAIQHGLGRAAKTLRNVRGAWIKEQHVRCDSAGTIVEYQVNMMVTFVLDD